MSDSSLDTGVQHVPGPGTQRDNIFRQFKSNLEEEARQFPGLVTRRRFLQAITGTSVIAIAGLNALDASAAGCTEVVDCELSLECGDSAHVCHDILVCDLSLECDGILSCEYGLTCTTTIICHGDLDCMSELTCTGTVTCESVLDPDGEDFCIICVYCIFCDAPCFLSV